MSHHLGFENETVTERSIQGSFNIELLQLNNHEAISYRDRSVRVTLLFIEVVLSKKGTEKEKGQDLINNAVLALSAITQNSEEKIRNVLKL